MRSVSTQSLAAEEEAVPRCWLDMPNHSLDDAGSYRYYHLPRVAREMMVPGLLLDSNGDGHSESLSLLCTSYLSHLLCM